MRHVNAVCLLQELFLAVSAEYTDWTRHGHQQPTALRALTLQALHDASVVAPVTATAVQIASVPATSVYFYVFNTSTEDTEVYDAKMMDNASKRMYRLFKYLRIN